MLRVNAEAKAKGDVETPLTRLHVHFGCGRLGMGLLSPAMAEAKRPVILIDGPFGDYEKLVKEGHKTVNFYVNGEVRVLLAGSVCFLAQHGRGTCANCPCLGCRTRKTELVEYHA